MPDATPVVVAQLAVACAVAVLEIWLTGGLGLIWPCAALFLGAVLGFWWVGRQRSGWPQRPDILAISLRSGLSLWLISTVVYATAYFKWPAAFEFSATALVVLAPAVGALPGLASLVLSMCAGDTAATILGSYDMVDEADEADEAEADQYYGRFTSRTRTRYEGRHGN